ncbi:MAG: tetratricopeptide repeat protein [Cytophagaceae bacterium]|nr:tetratricopeptide repeat protein [Cytophagaceae bacterium]
MRYRLIFLLLLGGTSTLAQHPVLDSLQRQLKTLPLTDTGRVNTLQEIAVSQTLGGHDSLARQTLNEAIRLAKRLKYGPGEVRARLFWVRIESEYLSDTQTAEAHLDTAGRIANALHDLSLQGQVLFRKAQLYENVMNKIPEANALLQQALKLFRQAHDTRWEALTFNEIAIMKMGEGKYAEAINLWLKARRIQEAAQDWRGLRATLPNLGAIYLKINRYDDALACFAAAEKVADRLHDDVIRTFVLGKRGEIMEKKGQYGEALKQYLRQLSIYKERHMTAQLARTYAAVGRMHIQLKQYDQALKYSTLSEQTYRNTVEKSQEVLEHNAQGNFGRIYLALKKYDRVLTYARTGLAWTVGIPEMRPERTEYHRQLAEAYEHLNQPARALYHFKEYKAESDTMLNEVEIQKTTAASMNYEFDKKEQVTRLQQARQQTQIQALENDKLTQSLRFLAALLVLSAGILGFVFWSNRRLRAKNEELGRQKAEIETALFRGQTMERKRVASELHDSVASKVSALKWRFEALDTSQLPDDQKQEHARLLDQMGEVYEDIRTISHNLMPEILEKHGLQAALIKLTDTLNVQNRTRFLVEVKNSGEDIRGKAAYELYAIALELVNNILKHANARQADITLQRQRGVLSLTVQDDGRGIVEGKRTDGIGFQNLRYRLEKLGGKYLVSTPESGGTRINVQVPTTAHT